MGCPFRTMDMSNSSRVSLWQRVLSRTVAGYPFARGRSRLLRITAPWLVAQLEGGAWVRTSGVVDAEWSFLAGKTKEERSLLRVRSFLSSGMTFVDVGANIGYFSLPSASIVGPTGKVIAFEPTPAVADRLRENIRLNRLANVTVVQSAVSDYEGRAQFFQSADDPEGNSLYGQPSSSAPLEVATVTLDDELSRRGIFGVNLIKIDAEGAELAVLKGARRVLAADHPAILLEVNPLTLRASGVTSERLLNQLSEYGYHWEEIERALWQGVTVTNIFAAV
jgi:FkbM family methyltransferase